MVIYAYLYNMTHTDVTEMRPAGEYHLLALMVRLRVVQLQLEMKQYTDMKGTA